MVTATTTLTVGAEDMDRDLDHIWPVFVRQCEEICGRSLSQSCLDGVAFRASINEVQKDLDGSRSRKKAWILSVTSRVGAFLEQFGAIVAQGASVVFGPSEQCWNAIGFVIKAAKSYREILEGFIVLLDLCANFLDRMLYYLKQASSGTKLEQHMRRPAYEFLGHFLLALAHSHTIAHSKKEKFNQALRVVFFNDDAGVQDEIEELKKLINQFNDRAWDQIYVDVKGITKYMLYSAEQRETYEKECRESFDRLEEIVSATYETTWALKQGFDHQQSEKDSRQNLKTIRDTFQLGQDEEWTKAYRMYRTRRHGTAEWLKCDEDYRTWKNTKRSSLTVLALTGKQGCGKSFTCSNAIDDLSTPALQDSRRKISVAFYFFDHSDKKSCTLERCIYSIIFQLAQSDDVYAKEVAEACNRERLPSHPDEVWKRLVLDLRQNRARTDFIILDEYRETDRSDSGSRSLSDIIDLPLPQHSEYSIRWLVTSANAEFASSCNGRAQIRLGSRRWRVDEMEEYSQSAENEPVVNESDLMALVDHEIARMCTKADLGPLLDNHEVKIKLVRFADGDYQSLQGRLNEIDATSTYNEVRYIISRASETSAASIRRVINSLNAELNQREIDQLNELLTWIVFGRGPKSVELLRSVLHWTMNEDYQLRKQITSRFLTLLQIVEAGGEVYVELMYQRDQVERALRKTSSYHAEDTDRSGHSMMPLQQCEIDIIEHFVKRNCTDDLYARFGFDAFFKEKCYGSNKSLTLEDRSASHAHIMSVCLNVLTERQDEARFKPLRKYATHWLGEHIKGLIDFKEVKDDVLREIGSRLTMLLWDPVSIRTWWDEDHLDVMKIDWALDWKSYRGALIDLLKHESIAVGFGSDSESHRWARVVLEMTVPSLGILSQVVGQLMSRAFDFPRPGDLNSACIFAIMSREYGIENIDALITSDLDVLVYWANRYAGHETIDVYFNGQKGVAYWVSGFADEALPYLQQAHNDYPENLNFSLALVNLYFERHDFKESLDCLQSMVTAHDGLPEKNLRYESWYRQEGLIIGGKCYKELEDYDAAATYFEASIERSSVGEFTSEAHGETAIELLKVLDAGQHHERTINRIVEYAKDQNPGLRYWILQIAHEEGSEVWISKAAKKTARQREICNVYKSMTEDSKYARMFRAQHKDDETRFVNWLHFSRALLTYDLASSDDERLDAMRQWERLIEISVESPTAYWPGKLSVSMMSSALLDMSTRTPTETAKYLELTSKLEALADSGKTVIRDSHRSSDDPRLSLARLRMKQNRVLDAYNISQARLRWIFDGWTDALDDDEICDRFFELAPTLMVLNHDSYAQVAFQAMKPRKEVANGVDQAEHDDASVHDIEAETTMATNMATGTATEMTMETEDPDSQQPSTQTASEDPPTAAESIAAPEAPQQQQQQEEPEEPEYYSTYSCDGQCGTDPMPSFFACRTCLDIQFCPTCHAQMLDELDPLPTLMCRADHEFLAVTEIDIEAWKNLSPGEILVEGKPMLQRKWLEELRVRWGLEQESIDEHKAERGRRMRAAKVVALAVGRYIRRKREGGRG